MAYGFKHAAYLAVFALVGHVIDIAWRIMGNSPVESWIWQLTPLVAEPYGFGGVGLLWLVYPLVQKHRIGPLLTGILGAAVTTIIEFICGAVIILVYGSNPYWSYAHMPFNLFGIVCLYNAVGFGLISLVFSYFIFPWFDMRI